MAYTLAEFANFENTQISREILNSLSRESAMRNSFELAYGLDRMIFDPEQFKLALAREGLSTELINGIMIGVENLINRDATQYKIVLQLTVFEEVDRQLTRGVDNHILYALMAKKMAKVLIEYLVKELPTGQVIGDKVILSVADFEKLFCL